METYLISATTLLILYGLLRLFRKFIPLEYAEYKTDKPIEELRRKYLMKDLGQQGFFIFLTVGFMFLLFLLFFLLLHFKLSFISNAQILVPPPQAMFFVLSLFGGMLLASIAMYPITKRQLKGDWEEFQAYSNLKYKFNVQKLTIYTIRIFTILISLLMVLSLDWYSAFGQEDIKINRLISIGAKTYKYSDVTEIKEVESFEAPTGLIVHEPHFIIELNDGEEWNSKQSGFADYEQDRQIIEFVSDKSNLKLKHLKFDH